MRRGSTKEAKGAKVSLRAVCEAVLAIEGNYCEGDHGDQEKAAREYGEPAYVCRVCHAIDVAKAALRDVGGAK